MKCDNLCTAHSVSERKRERKAVSEGDEQALGQGPQTRVNPSSTQRSRCAASLTHKSTGLSACGESAKTLWRPAADRICLFSQMTVKASGDSSIIQSSFRKI